MAAAAYLGTVAAHAEAEAQRQRDQEKEARDSTRQVWNSVIANPNSTKTQHDQAVAEISKLNKGLVPKGADAPQQALYDHVQQVRQNLQDGGHPEAQNPGVLTTLPQMDGSPGTPVGSVAMTNSGPAPHPATLPGAEAFQTPWVDGKDPSAAPAPQPGAPPAATANTPPVDNAPGKQPPTPQLSAGPSTPANLPPISPDASTVGPDAPIGTPAHAFATGMQHGAGKLWNAVKGHVQAGLNAYSQPGISLPPLDTNIDPSMVPMAAPPILKFDNNVLDGKELVASNPGGTDQLGQPLDDSKKYVGAPDPRGSISINGKSYSVRPAIAKPSSAARPVYGKDGLDKKTMAAEEAKGADYGNDIFTGVPISSKTMEPNEKVVQVSNVQGKNGYTIMTQNQLQRAIGGRVYGMGQYDQQDMANAHDLGVKNPGTAAQTETPVLDADNVVHMVPKYSSRTPLTPGATGAGAQLPGGAVLNPQQPTALPGNPTNVDLTNPHSTTGIPAPHPPRAMIPQNQQPGAPAPKQTASASPNSSMGRAIPGAILPGQANQLRNRDTALNGARTSFELATQPDPGTNQSYLDLFRDPNSPRYKAVANFLKLSDNMAEKDASPNSDGYFATLASYGLGLPREIARSQNSQLKDAYADVVKTGGEGAIVDYYNMMGNVGGMRKGSGGNSSQWNFDNAKKEVPNPTQGDNFKAAVDKMHRLTSELNSYAAPNLSVQKFDQSKLDQLQGGGTPTEGTAKVNSHGDKVVYRGGKWGPA